MNGASRIFGFLPCLQDVVIIVGCLHPIKPLRQVRMATFCMANFGRHVTFFFFILPFPYPLILKMISQTPFRK